MSDTITTTDGKGATSGAPMARPSDAAKAVEAKGKGGAPESAGDARKKARKGPVIFGTLILVLLVGAGLVFGGRWLLDTINFVSTDDAAIDGDHVNVSAKTLGRIAKLLAVEGDKVEAGQALVLLDDTDLGAVGAGAPAAGDSAGTGADGEEVEIVARHVRSALQLREPRL